MLKLLAGPCVVSAGRWGRFSGFDTRGRGRRVGIGEGGSRTKLEHEGESGMDGWEETMASSTRPDEIAQDGAHDNACACAV